MNSVNILENPLSAGAIATGQEYQKKAVTYLRLPFVEEIGTTLITYVKDVETGSVRKEGETVIYPGAVICRNPDPIITDTGPVYNEWVQDAATVAKNYGQEVFNSLTLIFAPFRKAATIKAVPLTEDLAETLGCTEDFLPISVSWSQEPMMAKVGEDYLTSGGYSISGKDMRGYTEV